MLAESNGSPYAGGDTPKLRTACENCRQSKVKCNLSGKSVCTRCLRHGLQCQYGYANRSGKPKGSKNRATLRKLGQLQEDKPAMRGFRSSRLVAPVADMESLGNNYGGHISDPALDEDVGAMPCSMLHAPYSIGSFLRQTDNITRFASSQTKPAFGKVPVASSTLPPWNRLSAQDN